LKSSVYALPTKSDTREDFAWLAAEADDEERLARGATLLDDLYRSFAGNQGK